MNWASSPLYHVAWVYERSHHMQGEVNSVAHILP